MGAAVAYIRSAGVIRNSGAYRISGQNCVVSSRHHWHPSSEYEGRHSVRHHQMDRAGHSVPRLRLSFQQNWIEEIDLHT